MTVRAGALRGPSAAWSAPAGLAVGAGSDPDGLYELLAVPLRSRSVGPLLMVLRTQSARAACGQFYTRYLARRPEPGLPGHRLRHD